VAVPSGGIYPKVVSVPTIPHSAQTGNPRQSDGSRLLGCLAAFVRYWILVILGVATILALMSPIEIPMQPHSSVGSLTDANKADLKVMINEAINPPHQCLETLSEMLLNSFLECYGSVSWIVPYDYIPVPKWVSTKIKVEDGLLNCFLEITFLGYPFHLSEKFRLAGLSGAWSLVPVRGSVGMLPIKRPFLGVVTPFFIHSSVPLSGLLNTLKNAETLKLRSGKVEFSLP